MAFGFTYQTEPFSSEGHKTAVKGTYTNTVGSTGGIINTGLNQIWEFYATPTGSVLQTSPVTVNGTFPIMGGSITIITDANQNGFWKAVGK